MAFIIQWQLACAGPRTYLAVPTPAGNLVVALQGDVIVKTDWQIEFSDAEAGYFPSEHPLQAELGRHWQNPSGPVEVKLLAQGTAFQNKVWQALSQIPYGKTQTYSAIAKKLSSAARAVGGACRNNPFPLLIPCHRVVSISGLGGYSGCTEGPLMAIKTKLLAYEAGYPA